MYCTEINEVNGGKQYVYKFPNGYGASVVKHGFSYGGKDDLWELAVLKEGELCYDTPITDDVLGHLTIGEVNETLELIQDIPKPR
jgi:hypothetical protein